MVRTAVVVALALTCWQSAATQTRGTLHATATVIDTRVSSAALAAVTAFVRTADFRTPRPTADSIALIRVERRAQVRRVVVTIDYSRN